MLSKSTSSPVSESFSTPAGSFGTRTTRLCPAGTYASSPASAPAPLARRKRSVFASAALFTRTRIPPSAPCPSTSSPPTSHCAAALPVFVAETFSKRTVTFAGHSRPWSPSSRAPSCMSVMITISPRDGNASRAPPIRSSACKIAPPRFVPLHPGLTDASCRTAPGTRSPTGVARQRSMSVSTRDVRSKATTTTLSAGVIERSSASAFSCACFQSVSRLMLALVSTRIATRRPAADLPAFFAVLSRKNGRANPSARASSTRQRSSRSQRFSRRLRRVTRGGVGWRNMSELNGFTSRVVRRMR